MRSRQFPFLIFLILIISIGLAACTNQNAVAEEPTQAPTEEPTLKPSATNTSLPEPTMTPKPTKTSEPTLPPTETPTATPEPGTDFSNATYFTGGTLPNWRYFFAIEVDEPIEGEFYALVDKNKEYACETVSEYPNRLYCSGPLTAIEDYITYAIYEKGSDRKVFEGELFIPLEIQ